jgi:hypothetical protein
MVSSSKIEIEKLNGHNFELWKLNMEDILVDQEQWTTVYPGTYLIGMLTKEWEKLERRKIITIQLCLADSVLLNVSSEHLAKKVLDKLGILYQ